MYVYTDDMHNRGTRVMAAPASVATIGVCVRFRIGVAAMLFRAAAVRQ